MSSTEIEALFKEEYSKTHQLIAELAETQKHQYSREETHGVISSFNDRTKSYRNSPAYLEREFKRMQDRVFALNASLASEKSLEKQVRIIDDINARFLALRKIQKAARNHIDLPHETTLEDRSRVEFIIKSAVPSDLPYPKSEERND